MHDFADTDRTPTVYAFAMHCIVIPSAMQCIGRGFAGCFESTVGQQLLQHSTVFLPWHPGKVPSLLGRHLGR